MRRAGGKVDAGTAGQRAESQVGELDRPVVDGERRAAVAEQNAGEPDARGSQAQRCAGRGERAAHRAAQPQLAVDGDGGTGERQHPRQRQPLAGELGRHDAAVDVQGAGSLDPPAAEPEECPLDQELAGVERERGSAAVDRQGAEAQRRGRDTGGDREVVERSREVDLAADLGVELGRQHLAAGPAGEQAGDRGAPQALAVKPPRRHPVAERERAAPGERRARERGAVGREAETTIPGKRDPELARHRHVAPRLLQRHGGGAAAVADGGALPLEVDHGVAGGGEARGLDVDRAQERRDVGVRGAQRDPVPPRRRQRRQRVGAGQRPAGKLPVQDLGVEAVGRPAQAGGEVRDREAGGAHRCTRDGGGEAGVSFLDGQLDLAAQLAAEPGADREQLVRCRQIEDEGGARFDPAVVAGDSLPVEEPPAAARPQVADLPAVLLAASARRQGARELGKSGRAHCERPDAHHGRPHDARGVRAPRRLGVMRRELEAGREAEAVDLDPAQLEAADDDLRPRSRRAGLRLPFGHGRVDTDALGDQVVEHQLAAHHRGQRGRRRRATPPSPSRSPAGRRRPRAARAAAAAGKGARPRLGPRGRAPSTPRGRSWRRARRGLPAGARCGRWRQGSQPAPRRRPAARCRRAANAGAAAAQERRRRSREGDRAALSTLAGGF